MNNKKCGNDFEQEFAQMLSEQGFWVHRLNPNKSGQPFDIIAVKDGWATAIDCKNCENDVFEFSRIEDNQDLAMRLWIDCKNDTGWFALKRRDGKVFMIAYRTILIISSRIKSLRLNPSPPYVMSFDSWCNRWT